MRECARPDLSPIEEAERRDQLHRMADQVLRPAPSAATDADDDDSGDNEQLARRRLEDRAARCSEHAAAVAEALEALERAMGQLPMRALTIVVERLGRIYSRAQSRLGVQHRPSLNRRAQSKARSHDEVRIAQ